MMEDAIIGDWFTLSEEDRREYGTKHPEIFNLKTERKSTALHIAIPIAPKWVPFILGRMNPALINDMDAEGRTPFDVAILEKEYGVMGWIAFYLTKDQLIKNCKKRDSFDMFLSSFLCHYLLDPSKFREDMAAKNGLYNAQYAAKILAMVVCVSDDYLAIKPKAEDNRAKFFKITKSLPYELQTGICNRIAGSERVTPPHTHYLNDAFSKLLI